MKGDCNADAFLFFIYSLPALSSDILAFVADNASEILREILAGIEPI